MLVGCARNDGRKTFEFLKAERDIIENTKIGSNYQLQVSTSLNGTFTNFGSPFTAISNNMVYTQYFDVANWQQLFFRVSTSP